MPAETAAELEKAAQSFELAKYAEGVREMAEDRFSADAYNRLEQLLIPDEGSFKMEICQLAAAALNYETCRKAGMPEKIYFDTMRAYSRFAAEMHLTNGSWKSVRTNWSFRHCSLRIFRVGALEYEFSKEPFSLRIHIPSDADFSPDSVRASIRGYRAFVKEFFPEFEAAPITCRTWLLSETLLKLLPETSNIVRFREVFDIEGQTYDCFEPIDFLFRVPADTPYGELPERTTLQRRAKQLLLSGGHIGIGYGTVKILE